MDRFYAITAFVAIARNGGFSAASRALGTPVANVSRKVALLEEDLGVRLFAQRLTLVESMMQGRCAGRGEVDVGPPPSAWLPLQPQP